MIIANLDGRLLEEVIKNSFRKSVEVLMASGYITAAGLRLIEREIGNHTTAGKSLKIVIGMALFDAITADDLSALKELESKLSKNKCSGLQIVHASPYHGKLYIFRAGNSYEIILGSSNLSPHGMDQFIECNIKLMGTKKDANIGELISLFNTLYSPDFSSPLNSVADLIRIRKFSEKIITKKPTVFPPSAPIPWTIRLDISIKARSGLNWNFGGGRPRNWYESYIPVPTSVQRFNFFPLKGKAFNVTTDDGWQFECKIAGTGGKNLESYPTMDILGRWLKGNKLKRVGLKHGERVTSDHLAKYGRDHIDITKLSDNHYFFDFSGLIAGG